MSARYYEYQQWLYDNYTSRGVVTNITFEKWKEMQSKKENKNKKIKIRKDMKIPFDIKFRPQIESGEYRVETQAGCPVRIVCWDMACELPILGLVLLNDEKAEEMAVGFTNEGTNLLGEPLYDKLFIVTPEPELTEFEKKLVKLVELSFATCSSKDDLEECVRKHSAELFEFAKDEVYSNDTLVEYANKAREEGRNEALKDVPRWRTIEEATEKRTYDNDCVTTETMLVKGWMNRNDYRIVGSECMVNRKMLCVPVVELEKLPGFKEDEK